MVEWMKHPDSDFHLDNHIPFMIMTELINAKSENWGMPSIVMFCTIEGGISPIAFTLSVFMP